MHSCSRRGEDVLERTRGERGEGASIGFGDGDPGVGEAALEPLVIESDADGSRPRPWRGGLAAAPLRSVEAQFDVGACSIASPKPLSPSTTIALSEFAVLAESSSEEAPRPPAASEAAELLHSEPLALMDSLSLDASCASASLPSPD